MTSTARLLPVLSQPVELPESLPWLAEADIACYSIRLRRAGGRKKVSKQISVATCCATLSLTLCVCVCIYIYIRAYFVEIVRFFLFRLLQNRRLFIYIHSREVTLSICIYRRSSIGSRFLHSFFQTSDFQCRLQTPDEYDDD